MKMLALSLLLSMTALGAQAQDRASIVVTADIDSAIVLIDGTRAGYTPLKIDSLPPGKYLMTIQHPELGSWFTGSITDTVMLNAGESRALTYSLTRRFSIASDPFAAEVVLGDSLLGTTPLVITGAADALLPRLSIRRSGYRSVTPSPSDLKGNSLFLTLSHDPYGPAENMLSAGAPGRNPVPVYLTGAAAVLSGAAAAYFKVKADNRYASYRISGNPALLRETNQLDTSAGIALAATQLSLGLFAYLLLSE